MKRITTLVAVMSFALIGAPLAALADHHEGGEKVKAGANANSNAQSSEDAKKGLERAAERHDATPAKVKKRGADEAAEAKAKADKAKEDAVAPADKATGDAKAEVDAAVPGLDAAAEVEAGAEVK